ncbi:MAG TPA: HAD-IA family hydrolase, partial [Thiolinea sp.]|nr:HAD-IA family hydrolase [Thiolinea sp.]
GSLQWYCLDYWQDYLAMDMVALKHEIAERIAIRAHVEPFLRHLRQLEKRIVLLTNAHRKSVNLKFEYVNLAPYFDRIITSHEIGLAKEQEGFWERLLEVEGFDREHSLFIDDNLQVLRNAQHYGVKYLLAVHEPDSKLPPKDTAEFAAVTYYQQLML